jgi:hypothetical protein
MKKNKSKITAFEKAYERFEKDTDPWNERVEDDMQGGGGGNNVTILSALIQVGKDKINTDLFSFWVVYVDTLERILDMYQDKFSERKTRGEKLAKATDEPRWRHLFEYEEQCADFSSRFRGFKTSPHISDLKESESSFFTSLEEYNTVKEIVNKINGLQTKYGIRYQVTDSKGIVAPINYDEGKLKKGIQSVALTYYDADLIKQKLIGDSDDSLVSKLKDADKNLKGYSRDNVKQAIADMVYSFSNNWSQFVTGYVNWYITGPAGSGKTTIAKSIGPILASMGILVFGNFFVESRATLVGQYTGQTAIKTRSKLIRALESVMFIDEAYAVAKGGGQERFDAFGREALDEIVGFLDKHQGEMSVIVAGYKCDMEEYFMKANEGLTRRFPAKFQIDLQRFCPIDFWKTFEAEMIDKVKFEIPNAKIENLLDGDAIRVIKALFYTGTGIKPYDPTDGTQFTFRHLLQNEASDAVEIAQELSILLFKNARKLNSRDVTTLLVRWLKTRDGPKDISQTFYDIPRDERDCSPKYKYENTTKQYENPDQLARQYTIQLPPQLSPEDEARNQEEFASTLKSNAPVGPEVTTSTRLDLVPPPPQQASKISALQEGLTNTLKSLTTPKPSIAQRQFVDVDTAAPAAGAPEETKLPPNFESMSNQDAQEIIKSLNPDVLNYKDLERIEIKFKVIKNARLIPKIQTAKGNITKLKKTIK